MDGKLTRLPLRGATFAVVDVETTGCDPESDRVVEIGCVLMRDGSRLATTFSTLVNPGRAIPATASAVHHLTDRDVASAPALEAVMPQLTSFCKDAIVVAYNADFDLAFLPELRSRPHFCAMRLAMHMCPEAPAYKNQVLRYHLGVDDPALRSMSAHRALADALVTSLILNVCLERYFAAGGLDDFDALRERVAAPVLLRTLPLGKHRGRAFADVDAGYLTWMLSAEAKFSADLLHSVRTELARRSSEKQLAGH
jgi:exodeoxyribonuclease X